MNNHIQCPYHGWEFDGSGECVKIPALEGEPSTNQRRVPSLPSKSNKDTFGFLANRTRFQIMNRFPFHILKIGVTVTFISRRILMGRCMPIWKMF